MWKGLCAFLLLQAIIDKIRTFVAKRDMSRIRTFLGLFYSDLTQTDEIRLRLNSDNLDQKSAVGASGQSIQIQPPGLVDKFGVWWVVWAGKVQRLAATWPPELISSLNLFSWCAPGGWPGGEGEEEEDQVHHDLPFSLSLGFALNSPSLDHNLLKGSSLYSFRCNWLTLHKRCQECTPPEWWSLLDLERGKRSKGNTSCKKPIEAAYYQQRAGEPEHLGFFICVLASRGLGCRVKPMKINNDIPSPLTRKISHK